MSTYQEVVTWLFDQVPNYQHQGGVAYKPGLERISELAECMGNPQKTFKIIHVAGTNGKGSVSHILANAFAENGYKTGLFTSPHIKDFRERIKINGTYISEDAVVDFVEEFKSDFIRINPSFFEITTAMAFKTFADHDCDIAIIETGLGGRLDSTNIVIPELSIITNIGLDHTAFLGNTLGEIALEKAGIIKNKIPVVIGDIDPSLRSIFEDKANGCHAEIVFSQDQPQWVIKSDLLGDYQQRNLHTAKAALDLLKVSWGLNEEKIINSFLTIREGVKLVGRMQTINEKPLILVDAAHNVAGIKSLVCGLNKFEYKSLHIIYGAANDKEWREILSLFPKDAHLHLASFDSKRSVTTAEFITVNEKSDYNAKVYESPIDALNYCKTVAHEDDLVLICGSFYLIERLL